MNVKLLRKVKKQILEEPRSFQMSDVVTRLKPGKVYSDYGLDYKAPKCGTIACIAGWTNLLASAEYLNSTIEAETLLGISPTESANLFLASQWPERYQEQWESAKTPKARARVAANRIEYFIRTGE